jgi:hypothetical protein
MLAVNWVVGATGCDKRSCVRERWLCGEVTEATVGNGYIEADYVSDVEEWPSRRLHRCGKACVHLLFNNQCCLRVPEADISTLSSSRENRDDRETMEVRKSPAYMIVKQREVGFVRSSQFEA